MRINLQVMEPAQLLEPLQGEEREDAPSLPVTTNEFGLLELEPGLREEALTSRETLPLVPPASPRKDSAVRRIQDDEILSCEGCGCYGLAGEFSAQNSCSPACSRLILAR